MKSRVLWGLTVMMALGMAGAGVLWSQEWAEPPAPPDPPDPSGIYILNDGHARLGVVLSEVTPEKAQELKLPAATGALVTDVHADSAAAKAGIEKGDVIVEFDAVRVRSSAELRRLIEETPAGRTVAIKVMRDGQARTLNAKLEAPSHHEYNISVSPEIRLPTLHLPEFDFPWGSRQTSLGISGDDLTSQLAQYFGVKEGKGVLVREVIAGSAAEKAGLKAGDVIVQVDSTKVGSVEELRSALNDNFTDDQRKVNLAIVRDHHNQTMTVELTRSAPPDRNIASLWYGLKSADAAPWKAQAAQLHEEAERLRREIEKQKSLMQNEWQRQLRQQMLDLREHLKSLRDPHVSHESNTFI